MPDETFSITFSQVNQVAGEFKAASQQSLEVLSRLSQALNVLEPEWRGTAKQRFYQEWRQWELTMRQFAQLLETVGSRLEGFATQVADADREAAQKISRLSTPKQP